MFIHLTWCAQRSEPPTLTLNSFLMDSSVPGQSCSSVIKRSARSSVFPLSQSFNPDDGGQTKDQADVHHLDSSVVSRLVMPMSTDENFDHIHYAQARSSLPLSTALLYPARGKRVSPSSEDNEVNDNDFQLVSTRKKKLQYTKMNLMSLRLILVLTALL
jgi:hypothetical protein